MPIWAMWLGDTSIGPPQACVMRRPSSAGKIRSSAGAPRRRRRGPPRSGRPAAAVGQPAAAPAEHDPAVARGAEVVEERAAVRDALAARPPDPLDHVGHRLREDDVGGGHRQSRPQRAERSRGGAHRQHGGACPNDAARRCAPPRRAGGRAQSAHPRVLEDLHAPLEQPAAQAERQPRRMHGRVVGHQHAAAKRRRVHPLAHLLRGQSAHRIRLAERAGRLDRIEARVVEGLAGRGAQVTGLVEPGVHVVVLAPRADRGHGLAGRIEQRARRLVAEPLAQRGRAQPERLAESAVPPAGAVAAYVALEQKDPDARLRIEQVPGSPHPRVAASDDHHVGGPVSFECRPRSGATGLLEPPSGRGVGVDMRTLIPDGEDPSSR